MENKDYLNDLKEIKEMMSKSSQFISLSGLSGVLAGIYAIIGAYIANSILYENKTVFGDLEYIVIPQTNMIKLLSIAFIVATLSIITGLALSSNKAKKNNEKIWNPTSYRLIINFAIPLVVGGYLCLYLIEKEDYGLVAPLMLIFYGLACFNASKYTLGDVRYLGLTMIILGIINTFFIGYGILFWTLGFGFCHIFYGGMMWFKHERK